MFLEICLVCNTEPTTENREINKFKVRQFDSKLYAKSCELFSEKLSFAAELIRQVSFGQLHRMLESGFIVRLGRALINLSESKNSKNRVESTCIVRFLLDAYAQGR
jgi:hypothetical protein